ncbi:MAG TPA: SpoIID/LytB domain-containing protein [Candidatus Atribacteria bacterium]|nr:SpoIID/LytB domain-containing protein [Candidatus Atribacteria bacterium]
MLKKIVLILCLILFVSLNEGWGKELEVTVNLNKAKEAVFSSSGGLKVEIGKRSFSVPPSYPVHFREEGEEIKWEEENLLSSEVYIYPKGKEAVLWGKRPYRGSFIIKASDGGILVINKLPLEDYIKGTMKLELSPSWPVEALKAQIIVSRTYALRNLRRHEEEGFNFCATEHCQRYGGINAEDPVTNRLVEETKGLVLTYQNELASVVFHSESGGFTESAFDVWGREVPYLIEVSSPWEENAPHSSWEVEFKKEEVENCLNKAGLIQGEILDINLSSSPEGRVEEVEVITSQGLFSFPASRFREALGWEKLPSTFFVMRKVEKEQKVRKETFPSPSSSSASSFDYEEWMDKDWDLDDIINFLKMREEERNRKKGISSPPRIVVEEEVIPQGTTFIFEGKGYGHGVGLSQWGAKGMAEEGFSCQEILNHYFPGCKIERATFK